MCWGLVTAHLVCIYGSSPRPAIRPVREGSRAAREEGHLHWHLNQRRDGAEPLIGQESLLRPSHWRRLLLRMYHLSLADNKTVKCSSWFVPGISGWGEESTLNLTVSAHPSWPWTGNTFVLNVWINLTLFGSERSASSPKTEYAAIVI